MTNRDLSVTVLKYFLKQRAEELASGKLKKQRAPRNKGEKGANAPPSEPQVG